MTMDEMIRDLIADRDAIWHEAKRLWDRRDQLTAAESADYEAKNARLGELDERIQELHELNIQNQQAEEYRARHAARYGTLHAADTDGGRNVPYTNNGAWRNKSDEDIYWRDFLTGRESRNYVDLDFTGLSAERTSDGRLEVRDLSTTTGSSGLVGQDFRRQMYQHLVESNVMLAAGASVLNTDHGRDIKVPKSTAVGTAAIVGEGSAIAEADGGFGSTTLGAWKYGRFQQATRELIDDSETDIVAYLAQDLGRSLGLASGADYINGTGTNQPTGLIVAAGTGVNGTVASGVAADELIDLMYSVSTPYRDVGVWWMNASTFKYIRKLKASGTGDYLISNLAEGAAPRLLGRPVYLDPAMSALGSANVSIAFGDPRAYFIRQAPVRVERSDDFAFSTDVVSWRAILRADGDLVDLTGAIKVYEGD